MSKRWTPASYDDWRCTDPDAEGDDEADTDEDRRHHREQHRGPQISAHSAPHPSTDRPACALRGSAQAPGGPTCGA